MSENAPDIRGRQSFWDRRDQDMRKTAQEEERQAEDRRAKQRYDEHRRERDRRDRDRWDRDSREDRDYYANRHARNNDRGYNSGYNNDRGYNSGYNNGSDRSQRVNYYPRRQHRVQVTPKKPEEKLPIAHITPLPPSNMAAIEQWWEKLASQDPHLDDYLSIPKKTRREMSDQDLRDYWSILVHTLERTVRSDPGARVVPQIKQHYRQILRVSV